MAEHAFSADVALTLRIADRELKLSHVGRDYFVVADDHGRIDSQEAILVVRVDESINERRVRLLDPIEGGDCQVRYAPAAQSITASA